MKIAIIQLARYGDICNAIPIAYRMHREGHEVHWVVHRKFADILQAVSYVTVHAWEGGTSDVRGAERWAQQTLGCHKVIDAQVDGNERIGRIMPNFTLQNWLNAGCVQFYHAPDTRLVFDKRDRDAERFALCESVAKYCQSSMRPIMAYCLFSHSSPFSGADNFERWLIDTYSGEYRMLPLHKIKLENPALLLGLIDSAEVLVTVDTLALHLSFATQTPVVALSRDETWSQSERRSHWLGRVTYSHSSTKAGRELIKQMIESHTAIKETSRRIVQVLNWYEAKDREERRRNARARRTWMQVASTDSDWETVFHVLYSDSRTSRDIGDTRKLPYLKDVIDLGCSRAMPTEYVVFTNADSCLPLEAPEAIRRVMANHSCCYSHRVDIANWKPYSAMEIKGLPAYAGVDLFCFTPKWWASVRDSIPDLLLGCEGWDFVMKSAMDMSGGTLIDPPIVYHEAHSAFWNQRGNILDNPGQKHNRELCREWAIRNGFASSVRSSGLVLFA